MNTNISSLPRATRALLTRLVLSALVLPACGDVVDGLSASSAENALCRNDRCDDDALGREAPDGASQPGPQTGDAGAPDACQADADCAAGYECEYEHGTAYCKPHGGHDQHDDHDDYDHAGDAPDAGTPNACYEDRDCTGGQRCKSIGSGQRACSGDDDDYDSHDGYDDDRSGPNRGRH